MAGMNPAMMAQMMGQMGGGARSPGPQGGLAVNPSVLAQMAQQQSPPPGEEDQQQ